MEQAILNFNKQFLFEPIVVNADKLKKYKHYILGGMGGSHLAAGILKSYSPGIELYVHRDYGIPQFDEEFMKDSLFIANSYSGNTEEIVDFAEEAYDRGFDVAVIATGGMLIDFAKENNLPYIIIPNDGIQPRSALGYSLVALAALVGENDCLQDAKKLSGALNPESLKNTGEELASVLKGKVPVIYSSLSNLSVSYNWKIKFNETAKVPAFYNVFPELNHNEINGFDLAEDIKYLADNFHFIFISDSEDNPQIIKRMEVTESIYQTKGMPVTRIYLEGNGKLERIFRSLLVADWAAVAIARANGVDPEAVPVVEDLKSRLK